MIVVTWYLVIHANMAANAWLSVLVKNGGAIVYSRNCVLWVDRHVWDSDKKEYPASQFYGTIVVRQNCSCAAPVEAQYYSAKLVSFSPVCYYCGLPDESLVNDDEIVHLSKTFAVVRSICFFCKGQAREFTPATLQTWQRNKNLIDRPCKAAVLYN